MDERLMSDLESHFVNVGVEGLLPQNLPNSILKDLNNLIFKEVTKKAVNVSEDRLVPALFCVVKILEHQNEREASDFEFEELLHVLEVYSANLGLELFARKRNFEFKPAISLSDVFFEDREVKIPRNLLTGN